MDSRAEVLLDEPRVEVELTDESIKVVTEGDLWIVGDDETISFYFYDPDADPTGSAFAGVDPAKMPQGSDLNVEVEAYSVTINNFTIDGDLSVKSQTTIEDVGQRTSANSAAYYTGLGESTTSGGVNSTGSVENTTVSGTISIGSVGGGTIGLGGTGENSEEITTIDVGGNIEIHPDGGFLFIYQEGQDSSNTLNHFELVEAARRMPPVLFDLDFPVEIHGGETLDIGWWVLGYHASYQSAVALFDCDEQAEGMCGRFYGDHVETSGKISAVANKETEWMYGTIPARKSLFQHQLIVPEVDKPTEMVLRFYRINEQDDAAQSQAVSLLLPGGLSDRAYYGTTGRRLSVMVLPATSESDETADTGDDGATITSVESDLPNPLVDAWSGLASDWYANETPQGEAQRRFPPVLTDIQLPEQIVGGQEYTVTWTLLGYHTDYESQLALFGCDQADMYSCAEAYDDNVYATDRLTAQKMDVEPAWAYKNVNAGSFQFSHTMTFPEVTEPTDFVIRLYRINDVDISFDEPVSALLAPGGLPNVGYLDSSGRRLIVTVYP
ncbi:MAG: hypothetical protein HQL54_10500 [Magnetococcales bacterium]|nr:hypothetical protein [Magnetococcales bacterium]